jgi:hypothetical protein
MGMSAGTSGYTELHELNYQVIGRTVLARQDATGDEVVIRYAGGRVPVHTLRFMSTVDSPYLVRMREITGEAVVFDAPHGVPLRALLAEQGAVTVEAALYLLRGSLCGLAAAHAAGVVHGGYRPEVALIGDGGQLRLIDAGIVARRPDTSATADIHAAIAAFVEFLTADVTFTAPADLIAAAPVTLRDLVRAGLAVPVDAVALLAMLDEVADAGCGAGWSARGRRWLAVRAAELRTGKPGAATGVEHPGSPPAQPALAHPVRVRRRRRSGRWALFAGVVAMLLVGGFFAFWVAARQPQANAGDSGPAATAAPSPSPPFSRPAGRGRG